MRFASVGMLGFACVVSACGSSDPGVFGETGTACIYRTRVVRG